MSQILWQSNLFHIITLFYFFQTKVLFIIGLPIIIYLLPFEFLKQEKLMSGEWISTCIFSGCCTSVLCLIDRIHIFHLKSLCDHLALVALHHPSLGTSRLCGQLLHGCFRRESDLLQGLYL